MATTFPTSMVATCGNPWLPVEKIIAAAPAGGCVNPIFANREMEMAVAKLDYMYAGRFDLPKP